MQESAAAVWPFVLYGFLVVVVVAGMLAVSHFLGERHRALGRNIPYESGITPTGSARLRYGIHFYTVAIFFILFDVEAVFLFAWAVAMRELGWLGYIEIVLFVAVLFLGLVYVWRLGGLDWSPSRRRGRGEGDDGSSHGWTQIDADGAAAQRERQRRA